MKKSKIAIIDDHKIVRQGLKELLSKILDCEITHEFESGDAFLAALPLASPPDIAAAAVAVPPAAPGARGPIMRHNEGYLSWEDVQRGECQAIVGQIKLEALPGGRDAPVWHMRVKENDGTWAQRNPKKRTARTSVVGDAPDWAKEWCQLNRECGCAQ